jgi:hypothetical protein
VLIRWGQCTNDAGHVVAEGSDDEFRTLTIDQKLPWLGVGACLHP